MDTNGVSGAPNESTLLNLMEKTGYIMIQENGQKKYGGPPPGWEGPKPGRGCEIFVGNIPRNCFEGELVSAFEKIGKIYEFRLMMDFSGSNRGYAFVMYTNKNDASQAVRLMNNYEIKKGCLLGVCPSVDNCRLFVGGIAKNKNKDEIMAEMKKVTDGVTDVFVYPSVLNKSKNRGFAFVEYESHRAAAMARRKLLPGRIQLWGHQITVDWAEPEQEIDDEIMSKVKVLFVRNLMVSTTEETILRAFNKASNHDNAIERVKRLKDYAFVHFRERDLAIKAMNVMNGAALSLVKDMIRDPVRVEGYVPDVVNHYSDIEFKSHFRMKRSTFEQLCTDVAPYMKRERTMKLETKMLATLWMLGNLECYRSVADRFGISKGAVLDDSRIEVVLAKPVDKAKYQRYARNKTAFPSQEDEDLNEVVEDFGYSFQLGDTGNNPGMMYNPFAPPQPFPRGVGRTSIGVRGMMRGRGRGAAGVIGGRGGFVPGLVRAPMPRYPTDILEEVCQKNGWGSPNYQLHSTMGRDGGGNMQLFLYKVAIPALMTAKNGPYLPNKLCRTVDEAMNYAAEFVLQQLGIPTEGAELYTGRPITIPTSVPMPTGVPAPSPQDVAFANQMLKMPPPPSHQIPEQFFHAASYGPLPPVTSMQTVSQY